LCLSPDRSLRIMRLATAGFPEKGRRTMHTQITAIYEGGILRLNAPLCLPEGTQVEVIVVARSQPTSNKAAEILAGIAALPTEKGLAFAGRDHDRVLYAK
jgi:predicted DNA-binding antitoxin AbrB/MazE fold protein